MPRRCDFCKFWSLSKSATLSIEHATVHGVCHVSGSSGPWSVVALVTVARMRALAVADDAAGMPVASCCCRWLVM